MPKIEYRFTTSACCFPYENDRYFFVRSYPDSHYSPQEEAGAEQTPRHKRVRDFPFFAPDGKMKLSKFQKKLSK